MRRPKWLYMFLFVLVPHACLPAWPQGRTKTGKVIVANVTLIIHDALVDSIHNSAHLPHTLSSSKPHTRIRVSLG
ncbi:hypothetical protein C8R43DRAFT_583681 [Mycena crocata]|nr:hypothetical protein C8R43DRAFT_583681 [Mycena crocata]